MDLYRYFHPHHNPRLRTTPLRMQELAELEQAALELAKAVRRAAIRFGNAPIADFKQQQIDDTLAALDFVVDTLSSLTRAHPGDERTTMECLLKEREDAPGWENWSTLLKERLKLVQLYD